MKAIRFMEPEVIEYSAVATPEPKDNEVLAQIAYAGFCATDIEPVSYTHLTLPTTERV